MNSLVVVAICTGVFLFGLLFYSRVITKILKVDPRRKTPAYKYYDGVDFVPAKHWSILFGHHFASIAGAAPIIGPILAVSIWGWGPTLLWVVLGSIFIGGVHDYASLLISVRHKGASIADLAKNSISKNAKIVFLIFIWLTLILIISVFVNVCARAFVAKPQIVIPSIGLIPVALVVGALLYNLKFRQSTVTVLGLAALAGLIFLGRFFPIDLGNNALHVWSFILLGYAFLASVLPVNILLQPRDYLATFLLLFGMLFGYAGIFITQPSMEFPKFLGWDGTGGMSMWPVLFVTVACGAISGFHSIVASGTTSKQLTNERDAGKIGYGAMIAEGALAVMVVVIIATSFKDIGVLKEIVRGGSGPVAAFGIGYSQITKSFLGAFGGLFAMMVLSGFVLTTLDTATRIGRYITQELFRIKNRFAATLIVVALAGWLGLSGEWNEIWPIFGAANQLIAALAFIVITSWLLSRRRAVMYTLIPMIFMLATATGALALEIIRYVKEGKTLLLAVSAVLLCLAFFIIFEAVLAVIKIFKAKRNLLGVKKIRRKR
ncbi:MAG: carbon starvation protein A [Candidatus Omnitrophica bacterium]|nr:carbon starvation protein A [Candidatus Omnitrophota bacterium]